MRCRDVSAAAWPNGHVVAVAVPAAQIDAIAVENGGRNRRLPRCAREPQKFPGGWVVNIDALGRVDQQLGAFWSTYDEWCAVRCAAISAVHLPSILAGARVDGEQVRR